MNKHLGSNFEDYLREHDEESARTIVRLTKALALAQATMDAAQTLIGPLTFNSSEVLKPVTEAFNLMVRVRKDIDRICQGASDAKP